MTRPMLKTEISLKATLVLAMLLQAAFPAKAQILNQTSVAFGNVVLQTTSVPKIVLLSNPQTIPLTISNISASGNFAETSKCPIAPKTLAAGASCQILVTFTPTVLGTQTATLAVSDN